MSCLFIVGFISILGQVALLRELNVAFYGIELIYAVAIAVWMLCTATGTWIGRQKQTGSAAPIHALFCLFAIALPLDVAFARSIRILFSGVPGAYLPFQTQLIALMLTLLPVGLLLGLMFRWAAGRVVEGGRSLALAYAVESAGGIAGGLCSTLLLKAGVQNFRIVLMCALAAMAPPLFNQGMKRRIRPFLILPALCLFWAIWYADSMDIRMTGWTHRAIAATKDTPYSRVTIDRLHGQLSVFENDALSYDTEGTEAEEFAHLVALQHPDPAHVLILGGGAEGLVYEILKHSPAAVDYVELDQAYLNVLVPLLPAELGKSLRAPGVRTFIGDPREVLSRASRYDLILVGMPDPESGQANRFYTREFYTQCRENLNPGGLVGFRLRSSENYWTPQLAQRMASIYRAAKSVFRDVLARPRATNSIVCSMEMLNRDPELPAERMRNRRISSRFVSPEYIRYLFRNDRFAQAAETLENVAAPTNTDTRPICFQYTMMLWLSKFFPRFANFNFTEITAHGERPGVREWLLFGAGLVLFAFLRRRKSASRALLVGTAAFLGMVLETLLMLLYQVKHGILYQDLGILLMSFMAGLTAGAAGLALPARAPPDRTRKLPVSLGLGLIACFALLSAWIVLRTATDTRMGLPETALLQALSGFSVAGIFAYASLSGQGDARQAIAPLYSADLIGGCAGSLAAGLLFIPVAGMQVTALWMIPIAVLAAVLV